MTDFNNITNSIGIPAWVIFILVITPFVYMMIYSILQSRQITILQGKFKTDADLLVKFLLLLYLIAQFAILVVAVVNLV